MIHPRIGIIIMMDIIIPNITATISRIIRAMIYETHPILPIVARIALKLKASPILPVLAKRITPIASNKQIMIATIRRTIKPTSIPAITPIIAVMLPVSLPDINDIHAAPIIRNPMMKIGIA
jgi:hypothetical protein